MTFSTHEIWIEIDNWGSLQTPDNTIVETFQVITAEVSEPPAFLLFGIGLLFCLMAASWARLRTIG